VTRTANKIIFMCCLLLGVCNGFMFLANATTTNIKQTNVIKIVDTFFVVLQHSLSYQCIFTHSKMNNIDQLQSTEL